MRIDTTIDIYRSWAAKLKPGERKFLGALVVVLSLVFYVTVILRPALNRIAGIRRETAQVQERRRLLVSQFPDIDKARSGLDEIKGRIEKMKRDSSDVESRLLSPNQVSKLLTQLVKCAEGLTIDFRSVKQKVEIEKDGGSKLYIEMDFDASYENTAVYVKRVETISPYIKIEELGLKQSKGDPRNLISAGLTLSAILAYNETARGAAELSTAPPKDDDVRLRTKASPLTPRFGIGRTKKKALKVTGITYRGSGGLSSAIINDTVVRQGDEIDGQKVEDILPDSVMINDGVESRPLTVER